MAQHRRRDPPGPARRRGPGPVRGRLRRLRPAPHPWGRSEAYADLATGQPYIPAAGRRSFPTHPASASCVPPLLVPARIRPARGTPRSVAGPRCRCGCAVAAGAASGPGTAVRPGRGHRPGYVAGADRARGPGPATGPVRTVAGSPWGTGQGSHPGATRHREYAAGYPPGWAVNRARTRRGGRFFATSRLRASRGAPLGRPDRAHRGQQQAARSAPARLWPPAPRTKPSTGRTPAKQSPPAPRPRKGIRLMANKTPARGKGKAGNGH